ncbi:ski2-like helicase [Candidatus Nitrososphaera gargensis Ga9.2]|uniref:ATP-dependent DNA helicase Hel308 n=1 Tax=Nitrososphaera gargensis (strain Ga9.2) TaxID=1237085 RepID=K0IM99_NITGG|nr:ski2-like helicase [Candidatus Nitrososphaera gargensis Ga9.2]
MLQVSAAITDGAVKALLSNLGYSSLYPPQKMALERGILEGKRMLVTTPTASGKTLIAMMAILKAVEKGTKAVYLTPLRALASEKYDDLKVLEQLDLGSGEKKKIRVAIATSDYDSSGKELAGADVIVLTNEKMDMLFRHNAEWLGDVGLFVSDEVHLIGDRERGPTLEMMLTKIRKHYPQSQVVALSATVANSDEIADWLGCELVESDWRPTKLVEGVYEYGAVRMGDGSRFKVTSSGVSSAVDLALDSLEGGGQALIFAETRKRAVSLAAKAVEGTYRRLDKAERELAASASSDIIAKGDDSETTKTLAQLVAKGVAFHHAGLGPSSRCIVEDSFKKGIIKILTATPTLAAGVNLPARRVVIASILRYDSDYGGSVPISVLEYKQLCGRAGRPKYDTSGEAIIVSESGVNAEELYDHYVLGSPEPLRSQLSSDSAVRFHLLSTIATVPGMKKPEIHELFASTLFARQYRSATVEFKVESALEYLEQEDLVKSKNDRYIATEFGRCTSLLYIDPVTAVAFRNALERVERREDGGKHKHTLGFLHLITSSPDFYPKLSLRKKDYDELSLLIQDRGSELLCSVSEYDCTRSFWALCEWMEETSDKVLGDKLGVEPGDMHRMVETGEWLAYSLYEMAKLLRREDLLAELYNLRTRIRYGVKEELLPLVALEGIGRVRARALYSAGLTDIGKIAKAPEAKLAGIPKIGPAVAEKLKDQLNKKKRLGQQ